MSTSKKLEHLITQMENYLECWKQFNGYVNLARTNVLDVQEELIATRGLLEQARADLAQRLGLAANKQEIRLTDALPATAQALPTEDALLDASLDNRFDVRVAYFAVQRAEANLKLECRRFLPESKVERGSHCRHLVDPLDFRLIFGTFARHPVAVRRQKAGCRHWA